MAVGQKPEVMKEFWFDVVWDGQQEYLNILLLSFLETSVVLQDCDKVWRTKFCPINCLKR